MTLSCSASRPATYSFVVCHPAWRGTSTSFATLPLLLHPSPERGVANACRTIVIILLSGSDVACCSRVCILPSELSVTAATTHFQEACCVWWTITVIKGDTTIAHRQGMLLVWCMQMKRRRQGTPACRWGTAVQPQQAQL